MNTTPQPDLNWPITPLPSGLGPVRSGAMHGPYIPASPDPLVRYTWSATPPQAEVQLFSLRPSAIDGLGVTLDGETWITSPGVIRLDFGVVCAGWVQFTSPDLGDPGSLDIGIAAHGEKASKQLRPVRHGEVYRLEPTSELYEGVRFAWLHINEVRAPWRLRDVRLICQSKPANYRGSFACSDPQLEQIWYTGAYTVRVCYQQTYMGSILDERGDRVTFSGDAHVAQTVSMVAFANYDFVRQNIAFTPGPDDHNGILGYPLYWILSIADYVQHSGDAASLADWLASAETILMRAEAVYDSDFHQAWAGWDQRLGGGFEFPDSPQTRDCYRMLAIRAWRVFADVLEPAGQAQLAERFRGFAAARIATLRADPAWIRRVGLYGAMLAVNAGFTSAAEQAVIATVYGRDPVAFTFISPFHQYFVLRALARLGRHSEALRLLREVWGGMLAHGATTCYELYRPELNAVMPGRSLLDCSLTHPWSAGATAWLSEEFAGIRPLSLGYATWEVAPLATAELPCLAAAVQTPHGRLAVRLDTTRGEVELEVPPGTSGRLTIPAAGRRILSITVDEQTVWPTTGVAAAGLTASPAPTGVLLDGLRPGRFLANVTYAGIAVPAPPAEPRRYPARVLACDTTTGGSWGGRYGNLGYQLLTGDPAAPLRGRLPSDIARMSLREGNQPVHSVCARASHEPRVAAGDPGNGWPREACTVTTHPSAHSVWLHLDLPTERPLAIALYLLDWHAQLGHFAVEMYDGASLELIAPTQVAVGAERGCYIRFAYDRSCVFRIYRGSLSGLFLDDAPA